MTVAAALELVDVTVGYGRRLVLDGVSFSIGPGTTFLVGENGAGKTSLFRVVLGVVQPLSGQVRLHGSASLREDELSRQVGYLPQNLRVPPHLRVGEFVQYMGWLRLMPHKGALRGAQRALEAVGLGDRWHDRLGELSGGMVRRVGLAQAIVHNPSLLLLDEPTVGLDPAARVEFRRLIADIGRNTAVLCSTHLLEDVAMVDGMMVALHEGHVAFRGPTSTLLERTVEHRATGVSALESAFLDLMTQRSER